jgi:hypothetical protein
MLLAGCQTGAPGANAKEGTTDAAGASTVGSPPAGTEVGCNELCSRHGSCFDAFHDLGVEDAFTAARPDGATGRGRSAAPCLAECSAALRDPVLGESTRESITTCTGQTGCEGAFGCLLRRHLEALRKEPWKRRHLEGRKVLAGIRAQVAGRTYVEALRSCDGQEALRRDLEQSAQEPAAGLLTDLDRSCRQALSSDLSARQEALRKAQADLLPDAHQEDCAHLRRFKRPSWLPGRAPEGALLDQLVSQCDALDAQKELAYAVQYAEADSREVRAGLGRRPLDDGLFHKCLHKPRTYRILMGSSNERARKAAEELRRVCFEEYPVALLGTTSGADGAVTSAGCYRLKQVSALLSQEGRKEVVETNRALISRVAERCP